MKTPILFFLLIIIFIGYKCDLGGGGYFPAETVTKTFVYLGIIHVKMECGDPCQNAKVIVSINDNVFYNSEYYADTTGTLFIEYEMSFTHEVNSPLWGFHKYAYAKGDVYMDAETDITQDLNMTLKRNDIMDQKTPIYDVFFADSLALM